MRARHDPSTPATRWQRIDELRLVGASGTNKAMAAEASRLAKRALSRQLPEPRKVGTGALVYRFDPALGQLLVHYHRTSARVFWDLMATSARRLEPLYEDVVAALGDEIGRWTRDGARISVEAHDVRAFEAGERQVVGTVKNAWLDSAAKRGLRQQVDGQSPDLVIAVCTDEDATRVSIDLAGRAMNQRGYRRGQGPAPLREDTAANLLMLARYDARSDVLIDPMAGSGTIGIEATCMADGRPLWVAPRGPRLSVIPAFDEVLQPQQAPLFPGTRARVWLNDRDATSLQLAEQSLSLLGLRDQVQLRQGDFRDVAPAALCRQLGNPERGLLVSNPPYGERLDDPDLPGLYRDLGRWCRELRGFRAAFLVANPAFEANFGLRPRIKKPMRNGSLRGYFLLYDL